jgi:hypothetical protein
VILTKEFLEKQNACVEGIQVCIDNNYFGLEYNQVIKNFISIEQKEYAGWLIEQKSTEKYVRANGSVITMGAYKVFNPITGLHTSYETEEEARSALVEVQKEVLNNYGANVVQELSNENGDTTWVPTEIHKTIVVS